MSGITNETRQEANEKVDRNLRYKQIHSILEHVSGEDGMTAREVAAIMYGCGWIPTNDRYYAAPRLTELVQKGIVDVVGKKKDIVSGVRVAAYNLSQEEA